MMLGTCTADHATSKCMYGPKCKDMTLCWFTHTTHSLEVCHYGHECVNSKCSRIHPVKSVEPTPLLTHTVSDTADTSIDTSGKILIVDVESKYPLTLDMDGLNPKLLTIAVQSQVGNVDILGSFTIRSYY